MICDTCHEELVKGVVSGRIGPVVVWTCGCRALPGESVEAVASRVNAEYPRILAPGR
jgi:hypothetical protein